jgi:hypothetical protein
MACALKAPGRWVCWPRDAVGMFFAFAPVVQVRAPHVGGSGCARLGGKHEAPCLVGVFVWGSGAGMRGEVKGALGLVVPPILWVLHTCTLHACVQLPMPTNSARPPGRRQQRVLPALLRQPVHGVRGQDGVDVGFEVRTTRPARARLRSTSV